MDNELTILVCSCDSYEDSWYPFFKLLKKYWQDCPYEIVLNTESKKFSYDGLNITCLQAFKDKTVPYGERLLFHLDKIKSKYVLLMLDDFFIRDYVNTERINNYLEVMNNNPDIATVTLCNGFEDDDYDDGVLSDCCLRPKYCNYKMNLQCGIWNREKFISFLRKNETPWDIERYGSIRCCHSDDKFYILKKEAIPPINYGKKEGLSWGIVRGKWVYDDIVPLFEENDISIDLNQRGFFDRDNYVNITVSNAQFDLKGIKSLGFHEWLGYQLFRVVRMIKMKLGLKYDEYYIAYKKRKWESKGEKNV